MPNDPSPPMPPAQKTNARGAVRVGPFMVLDELPGGGTARVFRARYVPDDATSSLPLEHGDVVVLKVMRKPGEAAPEDVEQFNREAEMLVMLDHPGIVSAISRGVHAGRVWMAMEYVEGEDLGNVIHAFHKSELRMRPDVCCALFLDVAAAIAAAHALVDPRGRPLGLVHRDLSPRNILLDVGGQARLFDFGTAILTSESDGSGAIIGTPGYLSPEQARGEPAHPTGDVYALGIIFYELLTGRRAFPVDNMPDDAILATHAAAAMPRWPSRIRLPRDVTTLVESMLAADARQRPQDGAALYHALAPLISNVDDAHVALSVVARDLVLSNRDRPPPIYLSH